MKYTLLEMTQLILSAMDSDEVNSISDTVESNQVALLLKGVYYDIATHLGVPEHESLIELTASGSTAKPVLMSVPSTVVRIDSISYNTEGSDSDTIDLPYWKELKYLPLNRFIEHTRTLRSDDTTISSMQVTSNGDTFEFIYRNDTPPTYYTSFDDTQLIFDSFDSSVDSTLQKSKTLCYGAKYPTFTMDDSFVPVLDPTQFSYYINKAKVRAFAELKQQNNVEASREAREQKIIIQKRQRRTPDLTPFEKRPMYGRK